MVPVTMLLLPVVVSAVIVFVVSSVIHMALSYHANDYRALPDEAGVMDALRKFNVPAGDYAAPKPASMAAMSSAEFKDKRAKGPVFHIRFIKPGLPNMGPSLLNWFLYSLVVSLVAGYVAGLALGPGAHYMKVFRFVSTVAFAGYSLALWQDAIWMGKSPGTVFRNSIDGLVYALFTAGTFGWLWPK